MWFFEGFCRLWNPKYVAIIDAGTKPHSEGLLRFFSAMERDKKIGKYIFNSLSIILGGVCGFLGLEKTLSKCCIDVENK